MEALIQYFIKVNAAFVVLYLFYRLLLHKDTFFREKRYAFLLTFAFALILPLLNLSALFEYKQPVVHMIQTMTVTLPDIIVANDNPSWGLLEWFSLGYGIIASAFLLFIIYQLVSILFLIVTLPRKTVNGIQICCLPGDRAPFSFIKWLFISPEIYSKHDLDEIICHEQVHIRELHSLDVIVSELICALFWINPFVWLLKRYQRENLEYLADKKVIHAGFDSKTYQYHLLRLSYQQPCHSIGNHFNINQLKNRIIMMNRKKTSSAGLAKYALAVPFYAFLLMATYAWGQKSSTNQPTTSIEIVDVAQRDKNQPTTTIDIADVAPRDSVYSVVDVMPQFPGGDNALMDFISKNLRYPSEAQEKGIDGRVIIRFVVRKTGAITNVSIAKGVDPTCDNEALRVIKSMPKWTPGQKEGKNADVYYTIPIVFKLSNGPKVEKVTKLSIAGDKTNLTASSAFDQNQPLIMVDGVAFQIEGMSRDISETELCKALGLKVDQVKSITVLKDDAAKKIYGYNITTGVIDIKTKDN